MADEAGGSEDGYAMLAQGGTLTGANGTVITRSPLFVAGTNALVLAAFDNLPLAPGTHPLIEAEQLVSGEWLPFKRAGAGGGSGGPGSRALHWVEWELPDAAAMMVRFHYFYGDRRLASDEVELHPRPGDWIARLGAIRQAGWTVA